MKMEHRESGAAAIETVLSLTFFMIAIVGLMMVTMIIQVQNTMQYALNQTAKEISGYYYLLDKTGIARALSGTSSTGATNDLGQLDETIAQIVNFSSETSKSVTGIKNDINDGKGIDLTKIEDTGKTIYEGALEVINNLEAYTENSVQDNVKILKALIQVFGRAFASQEFSEKVGGMACKVLMAKYLPAGNAKEYYNKVGIIPEKVDFSRTELMRDGRSIKLVVVYTLNTKNLTLGVIDQNLTFCQVAATAAWVRSDAEENYGGYSWGKIQSLSEISKTVDFYVNPKKEDEDSE